MGLSVAVAGAVAGERNEPEVDLIHESDVAITVSQRGSSGLAESLVDGSEETLWKPGGARLIDVSLNLQPTARAHKLGIAFKRTQRRNRVTCEVEISLGHVAVERFPVDPDAQPRHDIVLPSDGGSELTLKFAPIARKQNEGCLYFGIAEVYLTGTLGGNEMLEYGIPQVLVGREQPNFNEQPRTLKPIWKEAPFPTLKALCEAQTKLTAKAAGEVDPGSPYPTTSYCVDKGLIKPTQELEEPFRHVHRVEVGEAHSNSPELLVVQTTQGWYPANVVIAPGVACGFGGAYSRTEVDALRTHEGRLWIDMTRHEAVVGAFTDTFDVAGRLTIVCTLGAHLDCRQGVTAFGEVGKSWAWSVYMQSAKVPFHPAQWRWTRNASVSATGLVRFSRCQDPSGSPTLCEAADLVRLFPH